MRCAFDELPTAHGGLHNPVVWIGGGTRVGGVHVPIKRQLWVLSTDLRNRLRELCLHCRGGGAGITAQVNIDFGCCCRERRLVRPATPDRRDGALRRAKT